MKVVPNPDKALAFIVHANQTKHGILSHENLVFDGLIAGENPAFPQQPAGNGMIAGTDGSLSLLHLDLWRHAGQHGTERGWTAPMQRERIPVVMADAYHRQLRHFGRVIRGEEAPLVTARDASRSLAACLAVHEAARTGREVILTPVA